MKRNKERETKMETRKKRKKSNVLMGILIAVIVFCGVMATGSIRGWFGGGDSVISCEDITGIVNIERDGVGYSVKAGQSIQSGDIVETKTGSEAVLDLKAKNSLTMNENTELAIKEAAKDSISLEVTVGEIFADTPKVPDNFEVAFGENCAKTGNAVFSISMQQGSASMNVYEGNVKLAAEDGKEYEVGAGKTVSIANTTDGKLTVEVTELKTASLSNFVLDKAENCESSDELCFDQSELQKVQKERKTESSKAAGSSAGTIAAGSSGSSSGSGSSGKDVKSCTITIRCDTILNNMGNLTSGKDRYVPSNGVILATSTVEFNDGETVFDVLKRTCSYAGIPIEYSYTPMYESYYIEGINNLYEFDCGNESGWMYKVNGWFPNYGCSSYSLKDGDNIVWCYTCNGLGADVGGGM